MSLNLNSVMMKLEKVFFSSVSLNEKKNKLGYKKQYEDKYVRIYKRSLLNKRILSTFGTYAVAQSALDPNKLFLYPNVNSKYHKTIHLNSKTFPGLIAGSKIQQCMLLPYMRNVAGKQFVKSIRLNVITDKCQVFHNFPARGSEFEGRSIYGDELRFEESAVWDLPNHKYPSMNANCAAVEKYFPYLPQSVYEYHPMLNTDENFMDVYKNGGFGKSHIAFADGVETEVSRFYFPKRCAESNSFFHIGGEEPDYKMTVIGTYRTNNNGHGVRTVVFASSDGGRNWFAKYEFGDMGEYEFTQGDADWRTAFGNPIDITALQNLNEELVLRRRRMVVPTESDKEPKCKFIWEEPIPIKALNRGKTAIITTDVPHGMETGNIIAIQSKHANCYIPLCNDLVSENSGGNSTLFKINVIDKLSFEIYECVSSSENNICCRHIHQVNRIKDGWLIGSGEIYPNGWLLYMQMKEADTFSIKNAYEEFAIYRLNSSEKSVQRTLGSILLDDEEQTLIYASDHDTLSKNCIEAPDGRTISVSRSSVGVYRGHLKNIDDRNKFSVIYEAREPSFFFKNINSCLVFGGQRGELAISYDFGENWNAYRIDTEMFVYGGTNFYYSVLGDYIIELKPS